VDHYSEKSASEEKVQLEGIGKNLVGQKGSARNVGKEEGENGQQAGNRRNKETKLSIQTVAEDGRRALRELKLYVNKRRLR